MQFLVYITVLMVSIATVLLEVHWLTSPSPQPKPAIQSAGGRAPAPKVEGPNAALSPVYPRRLETPRPEDLNSNEQAQASTNSMTTGSKLDLAGQAAPAQRQQDRQTPVTQQAPITAPAQQLPAAATAPPVQKASPETTGMATREQSPNQASVDAMNASTRTNNPQEPTSAVLPSNNRCDVQACSSSYRSFRASDCTYQPFEGERRFCGKPPMQRTAREQRDEPERRRWSRDAELPRAIERRARDFDDDGPEFDNSERVGPRLFLFGGPGRW